MARSKIKGIYVAEGVERAFARFNKTKKMIKIYSRSSVILPSYIGKTANVYNGKVFVPVLIGENHVGHKFGEFSPTRVQAKHAGKKIKQGAKK